MEEMTANIEAISEEVDKVIEEGQEEIQEALTDMEFFQNDIQELAKINSLKDLLNTLDERLDTHSNNNYLVDKYSRLKRMLEYSYTMEPMFDALTRIKNKNKILTLCNDTNRYNKEMKKFNTKLLKNKFTFLSIDTIHILLRNHVGEENSKLFLYSLSRVVNSNGDKFLNNYSLFLNQLIKNIISLGNEDFEFKDEVISNIKKYCEELNK